MWSTLTAGLQLVQQRLDHVIDVAGQQHPGTDTAEAPSPPAVTTTDAHDGGTSILEQAPLQPATSEVLQQPPASRGVQGGGGQEDGEVRTLRDALQSAEDQVQLIHSEYRNICREKDDTIRSLKAALEHGVDQQRDEIVEKELAVHKEMVIELRRQLEEKESDLQELNSKAEAKFNKLKNQAKVKIAALSRELEQMKGGKGEVQHNTSQALEDSLVSGGVTDPVTQQQLDDAVAQLGQCKQIIASLESEKQLLLQEKAEDGMRTQAAADELATMQALIQREQENRLSMAREVTALESQLELSRKELCVAKVAHEQDQQLLEQEREQYRALHGRMVELGLQLEGHGGLRRDHSSASSDVQVISAALSQLDSEEEWKLVPSGSGNSSGGKSGGPYSPLEVTEVPVMEQRVMSSGDKGSLVDLESELLKLEGVLREREEELSSLRSMLELKDTSVRRHEQETLQLSERCRLQALEADRLKADLEGAHSTICDLRGTQAGTEEESREVRSENEDLRLRREQLEVEVSSLRNVVQSLEARCKQLEQGLDGKELTVSRLLAEAEEVKGSAVRAEQEAKRLARLLEETELTNQVLRQSLDRDTKTSADRLDSSAKQIEDLGEVNVRLQVQLDEKESHIQQLLQAKASLEQGLLQTRESLQNNEAKVAATASSLQQQLEDLRRDSAEREREARRNAQALQAELQEAIRNHELVERQLQEASVSGTKKTEELLLAKASLDELSSENSKLQADVTKVTAALRSAREEHAHCDALAKRLTETTDALDATQQRAKEAEKELVSVKADFAQRLGVLMQEIDLLTRERAGQDEERAEMSLQTERHKEALAAATLRAEQLVREKSALMEELQPLRLDLEALRRTQESGKTQVELLQGKVDEVSRAREAALKEQGTRHKEEAGRLQASIAELAGQVADLQLKLRSSEQKVGKAVEEGAAERVRREGVEADLSRLERENKQMKSQFNSAVELMETRMADLAATLTKAQQGRAQKEAECTSLREQVGAESRQNAQLREKSAKLAADCQGWAERCRLLEQEHLELKQRVAENSSEVELLRQTASGAQADRDAFGFERDELLRSVQEQESRTLELAGHVAAASREKELLEAQVRDLGRRLGTSEDLRRQLSAQLQEREGLVSSSEKQQAEIKYLTEAKVSLEHDRSQLLAAQAVLEGQVKQHQMAMGHLQQQLNQAQLEVEVCRKDAGRSTLAEELQRKLLEMEQTHSQHTMKLQHSLREEAEGRQAAERALTELRGEVSIGMEDTSTLTPAQGRGENLAVYLQIVAAQLQRFVRNPNIVLTRLLRATPQTKLLFMFYFVLLHLFVLYFMVM